MSIKDPPALSIAAGAALARSSGWSVISSRSFKLSQRSTTARTSRIEQVTPCDVVAIRVGFANWYTGGTGETPNTNDILVRCGLQLPGTTLNESSTDPVIPVTFNGQSSVWIKGGRVVFSDPLYIGLSKGDRYFLKTFASAPLAAAPTAPALSTTGSGSSLGTATYNVCLTIVSPNGVESLASAGTSIALTGQNIVVTAPTAVAGAIGYRVYMTPAGGSSTGVYYDAGSGIVPFTSTFTITTPLPSGAQQTLDQTSPGSANIPVGNGVMGGTTGTGWVDNGEGYIDTQDRSNEGRVVPSGSTQNVFGPVAVLGLTPSQIQPSVGVIGDSIAMATMDYGYGAQQGGFLVRACNNQFARAYDKTITPLRGHIWTAQGGESAAQFAGTAGNKRTQLVSNCTLIVSNYGTNDLNAGSANIAYSLLTIAARFTKQGKAFRQCTLDPKTTSTDGWKTIANQAVSGTSEGYRRAVNNWLLSNTGAVTVSNEAPYRAVAGTPSTNFYSGGDGTTTSFVTTQPFRSGTETVTVAGVAKVYSTDYTFLLTQTINGVSYASGIAFVTAPASGADVRISYTKMASFRTLAGSLVDVYDTAAAIEVDSAGVAGTNGGWWKAAGAVIVAARPVTATSSSTITDSTLAPLTQDQYRGYCVRIVSDTTTPAAVGQIQCLAASQTTGVLNNLYGWTTQPSTAANYEIYDPYCIDGTHGSTRAHQAKAALVTLT